MNKTRRRISIILLFLHNLQLLVWSALLLVMPERIFQVSFGTFAGRSWISLQVTDEEIVRFVAFYARSWGIQGLIEQPRSSNMAAELPRRVVACRADWAPPDCWVQVLAAAQLNSAAVAIDGTLFTVEV